MSTLIAGSLSGNGGTIFNRFSFNKTGKSIGLSVFLLDICLTEDNRIKSITDIFRRYPNAVNKKRSNDCL